jgi:IS6 family transposase
VVIQKLRQLEKHSGLLNGCFVGNVGDTPYRAVGSNGNTIDFMLSAKRTKKAAKRFLKKALGSKHNQVLRAITVDKNPAYPPALYELENDQMLPKNISIRQIK